MSRDRQTDPLKALARVADALRSSRVDAPSLRRTLDAARIQGIAGIAITYGPERVLVVASPSDFVVRTKDPGRWSSKLHRGHLEATGPDLRTEPFQSYLEALKNLLSHAMRSQERVDGTRERFRDLLGSFPAAVAMQRHGVMTYVNPAWTELTGGVNVGQSAVGWIFEHDRDQAALAVERAASEPLMVRLGHDPTRWVEIEASSRMAFDGQEVGLLVAREITERRTAHAKRAIRDRILTTRRITSGIGHELNNPLTAVMANLEVALRRLRDRPDDPFASRLQAELADAKEAAERMRLTIRDLRDLVRDHGTEPQPIDVRNVVDRALSITHRVLGHHCQVERHYEEVPPVLVRSDGFGHVMMALFQNVGEAFARMDGQTLRSGGSRPSHRLDIWIRRRGRHVSIEVGDDGPGVMPEIVPGLFQPFVGHNTGLGLTLAKDIVEAVGGTIRYDDRGGSGALFRVSLPIAEPYALALEPVADVPDVGRVLVIDDEPMIGRAVRRMLAPDFDVVIASTGADGLEAATANRRWDLVLLDLMMPGMGGVEVYEEIEQQAPELLPFVVVVTGGIYTDEAHRFLERTGCATLQKPFDAESLARLIEQRRSE
ncbi:MAG: hybrid sensor histidine kinase/response regulator [Myxococcota bacterium]